MSTGKLQALSSEGDLFAYSEPSGILKFWDTVLGKLVHEFRPAEHVFAQPTCLQFLKSKKCVKSSVSGIYDTDLLAIGNVAGRVLIYSPKQQKLVSTLVLNNGSGIVDIAWQNKSTLVSLAKDKTLTSWNISTSKKISEYSVEGNTSLCILGGKDMVVAGYGLQLFKLKADSIQTTTNFIGKSQEVGQLLPILVDKVPMAKYFLSTLKGSKLLYAWMAEPTDNEYLTRSLTIFNAEDTIEMVSCHQLNSHLTGIVCTTKKGYLKYFTNYFNGVIKPEAPKMAKAELYIKTNRTKKSLPIIGAYFLSAEMILISYGTTVRPIFERITVDSLTDKTILKRDDPMEFSNKRDRNGLRIVTPNILFTACHIPQSQSFLPEGTIKETIHNKCEESNPKCPKKNKQKSRKKTKVTKRKIGM